MPLKKLNPEELDSTDKLIHTIEQKDRRFRLFQTIFMIGTFISLIIIIGAQQRTLGQLQAQQVQAELVAADTAKRSEDQQDKIIRRLNCMVAFFSESDRIGLSIDSIDECTLNKDESVQQFFQQPEPTPAEQPPNLEDSAPTATQENDEAQGSESDEQTDPTPVEILGIPLCVPFTGVCVQ